jgi:serine phosphatase RsbU (regulator of sigma subunit)
MDSRRLRSDALAADFDDELRTAARIRSVERARLVLAIVAAISIGAMLGSAIFAQIPGTSANIGLLGTLLRTALGLAVVTLVTLIPRRSLGPHLPPSIRIEHRVTWLIAVIPFTTLLLLPEFRHASSTIMAALGMPLEGVGVGPFLIALAVHVVACSLLPLRIREVFVPILPFAIVTVLAILLVDPPAVRAGNALTASAILVGAAVPGALICVLREIRFRQATLAAALRERYIELREDLDVARRIHDRLLPAQLPEGQLDDGPIAVRYAYEPMREIGGDLLFLHRAQNGAVHVIVLDVTGHGIAAALLVNRIHGELLRICGTDDDPSPERVLSSLNEYLLLTVARDAPRDCMFATAAVVRVDPDQPTLRYASAAHPDLMVVDRTGSVRRLASTACVVGALPVDCFDAAPESASFAPGDRLLVYTDGLTETRSPTGVMWDIEGVASLLRQGESWTPDSLLASLRMHRGASPQDDCLIVSVTR